MTPTGDATGLLGRWKNGDRAALDEVMALLYEEMHRIASRQLRGERGVTVQPTSLVNEVYLRLIGLNRIQWQDRGHFLAMFARVARQTLVDDARKRNAEKRDFGSPVTMTDERLGMTSGGFSILEIDQLLDQLAAIDDSAARVVELRVFGGLSIEEAAEEMSISEATVSRKWRAGKAWLANELGAA
ncbi:MAG: sigma-70 family RNA polymerase sigma factor [Proteobacteria bacterium]|jgi:RNA polymerase sigma factor (TIGR02999 family)|nr:sigma-70 family RNA polymerase sigma factor [Pseudomonadota bacterium]MBK9253045.1 sigma-70 family RNA polymerase sigma factor [Pseudomonadota bacterium]